MKNIATLKKNYEFKRVLNKGQAYFGKQLIAYIRKNNKDIGNNILGIAIKSKLCKATKRNRIKRLIRENYRILNKKSNKGYEIVFILRNNTEICKITYNSIRLDIEKIFKKAKLLT